VYTKREWSALLASAEAGSSDAQLAVGLAYAEGFRSETGSLVVRRDGRLALRWLRAAADAGDVGAMLELGLFYDSGEGVRRNPQLALRWYQAAWATDRDAAAASNIATVHGDLGEHALSAKWFRKAAEAGDGDALVELAALYLKGLGVRRSPARAVELLRRANRSKQITEEARDEGSYLLANCYLSGDGVPRSLARARNWFETANRHGDHAGAAKALEQLAR
jgi:TPR repeat protein